MSAITSMFSLTGKTAIVTGVGPGMGAAVARAFAEAGANVVACARTAERVEKLASAGVADGLSMTAARADVSKVSDLEHIVDIATDTYGAVDVVFNNAHANPVTFEPGPDGTPRPSAGCLEMTRDDWIACLDVNILASYELTRMVLPGMRQRGAGSIVNVISDQAFTPSLTAVVAYGTTKAGLHMMTRFLAKECAPDVRVNALNPGAMTEDPGVTPAAFSEVIKRIPLGRLGRSEEIVGAALFLASDASSYVTGEVIRVDGGRLHASG